MQKNRLQYIVHNLKECFDGSPWYGDAMMKKLDAIQWQYVNEAIYGEKTIAVLVQHIINWRIFVLKKLQGDAGYDLKIDSPEDWSLIQIDHPSEWEELKRKLRETQHEILSILSVSDDTLLQEVVPGKKYHFGNVLESLYQHDIYHLGQIAMLNAIRKS